MKVTRIITSSKVAGVGAVGLGIIGATLGLGVGAANADPAHPAPRPGVTQQQNRDQVEAPVRGDYKKPVFYRGGWHKPIWDNGHHQWGFRIGSQWFPVIR